MPADQTQTPNSRPESLMILTSAGIESRREAGELVIEPFTTAALNPNSYDLHLAPTLIACEDEMSLVEIPEEGFVLQRLCLYLGATIERFGGREAVPLISGRSSVGRLGLFVHLAADMGNLGAVHSWTLELFAAHDIRVYSGMPIVQVSFWRARGIIPRYGGTYDDSDAPTPANRPLGGECIA